MKLTAFLAAVRRYWKTFVAVATVVFAAVLALILLAPAKFVSTVQLMVSISGSTTAAAYQNDDVVAGRVNSYIALLSSDVVSQRVIDKLGLPMTAPELAAKISATNVPPKTSVIDVAVTDESPERARLLANTLANEFISYATALETPTGEDDQKVRTTVVSGASEPRGRRAERVVLGVLAALAALLLGAVAVWIRSLFDPVVRTAERAAAEAGVPVIGYVTAAPAASLDDLEGYRRLRTRLRTIIEATRGADDQAYVLLLACTVGEVDTAIVASNVGRATELAGARAIVVDAQIAESEVPRDAHTTPHGSDPQLNLTEHEDGEPTGHSKPESDNETAADDGAARVVTDTSVAPSIRPGGGGLPDTVSVGASADGPNRFSTTATAELFDKLRSQYARVIIAAPPALGTSTASVVGEYADGVLLLVALGATRRRDLRGAAQELRSVGLPLAATVLVGNEDSVGSAESRSPTDDQWPPG